jgi:hypothetical protein
VLQAQSRKPIWIAGPKAAGQQPAEKPEQATASSPGPMPLNTRRCIKDQSSAHEESVHLLSAPGWRRPAIAQILEVASDFRSTEQLRHLLELANACLAQGGRLVFNVFLPLVGYRPDESAQQVGQQIYIKTLSYPEVSAAASGLTLTIASDDSACDYEQQHLPAEA